MEHIIQFGVNIDADVMQATLNLVAALGVEDFRPWMDACERRNRARGRITDGKVDE